MVDGLSPFYKGAYGFINLLKRSCGQVKAVAGFFEGITVFGLRFFCVIEVALIVTYPFLFTGVARVDGIIDQVIALCLYIVTAIFFGFVTGFAFLFATPRAADMVQGAVRGS